MSRGVAYVMGAASAALAVCALAEIVNDRASRQHLGSAPGPGETDAIVVLGFKNAGRRINRVNRYRVRAALRSIDPNRQTTVITSGGGVGSPIPEADLLADHARQLGYGAPIIRERESRTTLQNIENVIPHLEAADRIIIISNPQHAAVGRANLWRLRPDLAQRLAPGREQQRGEVLWLKVPDLFLELGRGWFRRAHHPRDLPHTHPVSPAA